MLIANSEPGTVPGVLPLYIRWKFPSHSSGLLPHRIWERDGLNPSALSSCPPASLHFSASCVTPDSTRGRCKRQLGWRSAAREDLPLGKSLFPLQGSLGALGSNWKARLSLSSLAQPHPYAALSVCAQGLRKKTVCEGKAAKPRKPARSLSFHEGTLGGRPRFLSLLPCPQVGSFLWNTLLLPLPLAFRKCLSTGAVLTPGYIPFPPVGPFPPV